MNTQDRAVVKALLQYMTDKCLTGSEEFRAAMKHFNITTTYEATKYLQDIALTLGVEDNEIVDVFSANTVHPVRHTFATADEAKTFAAAQRATGDEPVNTRVLNARAYLAETLVMNVEAAHAEALEMDAEFNFEEVSRAINISDLPRTNEAQAVDAAAAARAIIARAIHAGANNFGGVIGEHEELVDELRNAGFADAAEKVDAVYGWSVGNNHKDFRKSWLAALRNVSATI